MMNGKEAIEIIMELVKNINLALRFLLELCMLIAFGYWGFRIGSTLPTKIGLGIGVPIVVIVIWGAFVAPNAAVHLSEPIPLILGLLILLLAAAALIMAGQRTVGIVFGVIVILNAVLMLVWRQ